MKLKTILSKMASFQKVKIIKYSAHEIIFEGIVGNVSKELKERNVAFIGISNFQKEIMIDVM